MDKLQSIQGGICFLLGLIFIHCTPSKELVNNTTKPAPTNIIFQQLDGLIQTNLDFDKLPFVHKIKMQETLKDDDFIDAQVLQVEDMKATQQITFWGMQLFDEFEYLLDISVVW